MKKKLFQTREVTVNEIPSDFVVDDEVLDVQEQIVDLDDNLLSKVHTFTKSTLNVSPDFVKGSMEKLKGYGKHILFGNGPTTFSLLSRPQTEVLIDLFSITSDLSEDDIREEIIAATTGNGYEKPLGTEREMLFSRPGEQMEGDDITLVVLPYDRHGSDGLSLTNFGRKFFQGFIVSSGIASLYQKRGKLLDFGNSIHMSKGTYWKREREVSDILREYGFYSLSKRAEEGERFIIVFDGSYKVGRFKAEEDQVIVQRIPAAGFLVHSDFSSVGVKKVKWPVNSLTGIDHSSIKVINDALDERLDVINSLFSKDKELRRRAMEVLLKELKALPEEDTDVDFSDALVSSVSLEHLMGLYPDNQMLYRVTELIASYLSKAVFVPGMRLPVVADDRMACGTVRLPYWAMKSFARKYSENDSCPLDVIVFRLPVYSETGLRIMRNVGNSYGPFIMMHPADLEDYLKGDTDGDVLSIVPLSVVGDVPGYNPDAEPIKMPDAKKKKVGHKFNYNMDVKELVVRSDFYKTVQTSYNTINAAHMLETAVPDSFDKELLEAGQIAYQKAIEGFKHEANVDFDLSLYEVPGFWEAQTIQNSWKGVFGTGSKSIKVFLSPLWRLRKAVEDGLGSAVKALIEDTPMGRLHTKVAKVLTRHFEVKYGKLTIKEDYRKANADLFGFKEGKLYHMFKKLSGNLHGIFKGVANYREDLNHLIYALSVYENKRCNSIANGGYGELGKNREFARGVRDAIKISFTYGIRPKVKTASLFTDLWEIAAMDLPEERVKAANRYANTLLIIAGYRFNCKHPMAVIKDPDYLGHTGGKYTHYKFEFRYLLHLLDPSFSKYTVDYARDQVK